MVVRKHLRIAVVLAPLIPACASPAAPQESRADAPAASVSAAEVLVAPPEVAAPSAVAPAEVEAPAPGPVTPRVYAKTRFVWVHYEPSAGSGWLGYLWMGGSAELKDPKPIPGSGGCNSWYAVKPRGFVCADGGAATLDASDPVLVAMKPYVPDLSSPWPHRYAESRGAERYFSLPSPDDQRGREWDLVEHKKQIEASTAGVIDEALRGVDLTHAEGSFLLPELPSTVRERRRRMNPLSTVAWSRELEHEGRTFLLTGDYAYVPKDRVVPYPVSRFHGTPLGEGVELPLAFFRERARPKFSIGDDGVATPTGESFERHAFVGITGQSRQIGEIRYLETRESGVWVLASDATVVKPQEKTPWGATVGAEDIARGPSGRRSWVEVSILGGWLIAYEGTRPVYATLVSPGRGGLPQRDVDPLVTAATPMGTWPISGKFATATMVAPGEFIHSDVPWTQNFHGPHALHGAYWHDAWGEKKSAGCVNVSPIDGKWLYEFTDPKVPEGWHGIRFDPETGPATTMVVHS